MRSTAASRPAARSAFRPSWIGVVEVARQLGNGPEVTLNTYAHIFEELDPAQWLGAVEAARAEFRCMRKVR